MIHITFYSVVCFYQKYLSNDIIKVLKLSKNMLLYRLKHFRMQ